MLIQIVTIFPEMFKGPFQESIIGRAVAGGMAQIQVVDLRDYTTDRHRQVDDYPYGGGKGMVLKPEPLFRAVEDLNNRKPEDLKGAGDKTKVILLSPRGEPFTQNKARELSEYHRVVLLCGHYEGVDQRVTDYLVHEEISIGDYVLTGGELPAMVITDALVRLQPGVLSQDTLQEESFEGGILEYPQYTRPRVYRDMPVPDVLLSGNHALISKWRQEQALENTRKKRPDLLR